jgi:1-acyl-sn-glycerol-3-phosphate acyltransferase
MIIDAERWVLQQDELFRSRRDFYRNVVFDRVVRTLFWNVTITGLENIPKKAPVIIMMNHLAAIDPFVVAGAVRPRYVVPMSKIENFENPIVGILARTWGAYPVRRGEVDRDALRIAMALMKAGEVTLIAPEGTRNRALQRPHDGLAYIASKTNPVVVPTAVFNHATWLKDLLIPWKRTPVQVSFGRGFRLKLEDRKRIPRDELNRFTDEMMYQLALLLPEHNRGEYSDLSKMTTDHLKFFDPASES